MIEFIISYSRKSFTGVTEGEVHMYAEDKEQMRDIIRDLGVTCSFGIRAAKTKLTRCPECGGCGLMRSAVDSYTPSLSYDCDRCDATGEV